MLKNNYLSLCNDATQKLMTLFYDSWLETGNAQTSLKEGQKELCKDQK